MNGRLIASWLLGTLSALGLCAAGCGDDGGGNGLLSAANGDNAITEGTEPATTATVNPGDMLFDPSTPGGVPPAEVDDMCTGAAAAAEVLPVDILIMMDQSISMAETLTGDATGPRRWDAVRDALIGVVGDARLNNIRIGLNYFGDTLPPYECMASEYFEPEVDIDLAPNNAQAIIDSLNSREPTGFTPTFPALDGAIQFAQEYDVIDPTRATIVVLVTDGLPSSGVVIAGETIGCNDSVPDIAALAAAGLGSDQAIRTFVVGISAGVSNLESIAAAGGGQAFIIGEGDLQAQFVNAILSIVAIPLDCTLPVPDAPMADQVIDPSLVAVSFTPLIDETRMEIPRLRTSTDCGIARNGQGWFFDDPLAPETITLCPLTCNSLGAGSLNVEFGCEPLIGIQ